MVRRFLTFLCVAGAVLCSGIRVAQAHAFVDGADPPVGATLKMAPTALTITFTEALEPHFSTITVQDAAGARVDLGDAHAAAKDAMRFVVGLKALVPGTYTVLWRVTSVDTHKTTGSYHFTVAP